MGRVIRGKHIRSAYETFLAVLYDVSPLANSPEKGKKHNFQISLIKENRSCSIQNPRLRRKRRVSGLAELTLV